MLLFCFFFQAEDGIRDYKVTGVQTCALPIYDDGLALSVLGRSTGLAHHSSPCFKQGASIPYSYRQGVDAHQREHAGAGGGERRDVGQRPSEEIALGAVEADQSVIEGCHPIGGGEAALVPVLG